MHINYGGILDLIKLNSKNNAQLIKSAFKVLPLDFTETSWSEELSREVADTDIILAADVIYDDDITAAFVSTLQRILNTRPPKTLYMALEKRYVFTIEHLDSVAPCYETFLTLIDKVNTDNPHSKWTMELLPLNFPKYFTYERAKELLLWKICSTPC
ncbi:unnamed protein product [Plutella xylostella]|uniref:(diamondback moth) hypothetical protein n=1 Tax=Plutella xylostella TaxID=51655 RepID=A0A8S4D3G9_PLUXY|nr:unnamed protein product [Plutella xylostella]